ncbi:MAG: HAD-IIB family hydrolase [Thiobacillus sp.]|nr:HAD-IIB family hydrolase [Thiobacillus sp.]
MDLETPILLATDLDRTLLPNGAQPESPLARPRFRRFVALPEVKLAYVTGRHKALVEQAMAEFDLPTPDFVIGDVGTSIYEVRGHAWRQRPDWQEAIAADWQGNSHGDLAAVLADVEGLRLQEAAKQGPCKLSYYADPLDDPADLMARVRARLDATGARCNLVWSVDETTATGLLDVLPARASKLHALEFLREHLGIPLDHTVFAGDSGNDMEVLESEVPSVLVANARETVRNQAVARAVGQGHGATLYLAQGGLGGMNGNYSAGILEGVAHFIPATRLWLEI